MMSRDEYLKIAAAVYDRAQYVVKAGIAAGAYRIEAALESSDTLTASIQDSSNGHVLVCLWVSVERLNRGEQIGEDEG